MRIHKKFMYKCSIVILIFFALSIWFHCGDYALPKEFFSKWDRTAYGGRIHLMAIQEIECRINQEYTVPCRRESDEVYIPFSFIRDYFEVYGSFSTSNDGINHFDWLHTNAKINYPKPFYDPHGIFMYFENYNVEMRDRVKCITATEGVPLSTQWQPQGYYYPTQIAQFGLSHYSKNFSDPEPRIKIIEDGDQNQGKWSINQGSNLTRSYDEYVYSSIATYSTTHQYNSNAINISLNISLDLVLKMDIWLSPNSSIIVLVENQDTLKIYHLHYIVSDILISVKEDNFYYGIGTNMTTWKRLIRDIFVDIQKGIQLGTVPKKKHKIRRSDLKANCITLIGSGYIDNITFSTNEHIAQFYDAAEWFVHHQDQKTGGWPNPVKRKLSEFSELKPGWYSGMGQGHAISLLSRAFYHSKGDKRYIKAALNALKPFRIPSRQGGVLAKVFGKFDWYEEYPTIPASFVLNGFIYALLGLYDLNATAPMNIINDAAVLYERGMISLKKLLSLFDTGSGTIYDLRHITLGIEPNIARWDYHATHVNQLLLLATIDNDPLIGRTADRWRSYMSGKRAAHN